VERRVAKSVALLTIEVLLVLVLSRVAPAQDWESLRDATKSLRSLKARFIQKKDLKILSEPLVSEGRLYYRATGSLRWEYIAPLKSTMILSKGAIQLYTFSEGTWRREPAQAIEARRMVLSEIGQWLQGRFEETGTFTASYSPGPPVQVTLMPREGLKGFLTRIELIFSDRPGVIHYVEIIEPGKNRTKIEFIDVEINPSLPDEIFEKP
jgi:outer membrane lipoprotein-sorting protein